MKLHLPKILLTAVVTLMSVPAWGGITSTEGTPVDGVTPVTVTFTDNSQTINLGNYADTTDKKYTLVFATTSAGNNYFLEGSCETNVDVQIGQIVDGTYVTGSGLYITNGYSGSSTAYRNYKFNGKVSGQGEFKFSTSTSANYFNFVFGGDMSSYSGNMTLAGDTKNNKLIFNNNTSGTGAITASGSNSVEVNGATMKNSSITAGTLSVSGTSTFSGAVYANTLQVADDSNVTFNGNVEVVGTSIGEFMGYSVSSSDGLKNSDSKNGYALDGKWLAINNKVTFGAQATLTVKDASSVEFVEGKGYVASAAEGYGKIFDKTRFYVNEGTVTWGTDGYTDAAATNYVVASDATFDLNGRGFEGKTVTLAKDAVFANTTGDLTDNSILLSKIELTGDAKLDIKKNHGILARAWGNSNLAMNGHTLTKSGDATFYLVNTTVAGSGTIAATEGTLQIGSSVNNDSAKNKVTTANDVVFTTSTNGKITLVNGAQLHAKAISGEDGSVEGVAGTLLKLTTDANHSYGGDITGVNLEKNGSGTQALNGTNDLGAITLNKGALAVGGNTEADSLTLGDTAMLEFAGGTLTLTDNFTLDVNAMRLAQDITFTTAEDYAMLKVEGADKTLSVNGIENWKGNGSIYNIGGVDYTAGLNLVDNTLKLSFTALPVPEPTTATLSLLALAGLAARRRRR